jgi:hypothetical protein
MKAVKQYFLHTETEIFLLLSMSKNGTEQVLIRYVVRVFLRVRDMDYAVESHREEFEASRLKTILTAETSKMSIYVDSSHAI